jgi:hypothetical protein
MKSSLLPRSRDMGNYSVVRTYSRLIGNWLQVQLQVSQVSGNGVIRALEINATQNAAADPGNHSTGTRSFSSSSQFRTMLILRGISAAEASSTDSAMVVTRGFISRNRLPSGWTSQ